VSSRSAPVYRKLSRAEPRQRNDLENAICGSCPRCVSQRVSFATQPRGLRELAVEIDYKNPALLRRGVETSLRNCGTIGSETTCLLAQCPSCQTVFEGQPKFCGNCGHQFASDAKANAVLRKTLTPKQAGCGCLSAMAIIMALMISTTPKRTEPAPTISHSFDAGNRFAPERESKVMLYMSCLGFTPSTAAKTLNAAHGDLDKVLIITHLAVSGELSGKVPLNEREKACLKRSGL